MHYCLVICRVSSTDHIYHRAANLNFWLQLPNIPTPLQYTDKPRLPIYIRSIALKWPQDELTDGRRGYFSVKKLAGLGLKSWTTKNDQCWAEFSDRPGGRGGVLLHRIFCLYQCQLAKSIASCRYYMATPTVWWLIGRYVHPLSPKYTSLQFLCFWITYLHDYSD